MGRTFTWEGRLPNAPTPDRSLPASWTGPAPQTRATYILFFDWLFLLFFPFLAFLVFLGASCANVVLTQPTESARPNINVISFFMILLS
jgi:hypothetical protein